LDISPKIVLKLPPLKKSIPYIHFVKSKGRNVNITAILNHNQLWFLKFKLLNTEDYFSIFYNRIFDDEPNTDDETDTYTFTLLLEDLKIPNLGNEWIRELELIAGNPTMIIGSIRSKEDIKNIVHQLHSIVYEKDYIITVPPVTSKGEKILDSLLYENKTWEILHEFDSAFYGNRNK
jgi:hypothetical protein